jgi:hypothetical protein
MRLPVLKFGLFFFDAFGNAMALSDTGDVKFDRATLKESPNELVTMPTT